MTWALIETNMLNCHHIYVTWCVSGFGVPDVLPVHGLKKLMTLDLLHTHSSNPVLSVCAISETHKHQTNKHLYTCYLDNYSPSTPTCLARGQKMEIKGIFTYFNIKSLALSEMGTSGGKTRVSFQFITFLYVSCGVSEQKGG